MQRHIINKLATWKKNTNRKPLILQGARQVGKTWAMQHFGEVHFEQMAYVNFDNNSRMQALFESDFDLERILLGLRIETGVDIAADNTLIIFDEIQEVPNALTALKYFYENAPDYYLIAAGSLLGVALAGMGKNGKAVSFPVGKVDFLPIYPMSFAEFLLAMNDADLLNLLRLQDWALIAAMKSKFIERLKQYYYVGGMPEAVQCFVDTQDVHAVRAIQQNLLIAYEQDFSKHIDSPTTVARVRSLWQVAPSELAKENKKFVVSSIKKGARFKDIETALQWLKDCGLLNPVYRIKKPNFPMVAYQENVFKLYHLDIGLLGAQSQLDAKVLLDDNRLFTEFKGALTEQYVLQQLQTLGYHPLFYWATDRATAEVDFIIAQGQTILPIEVKAEENLKAKSLKVYTDKYTPQKALRFSMADFREQDWLLNLPLYALSVLPELAQLDWLLTLYPTKNSLYHLQPQKRLIASRDTAVSQPFFKAQYKFQRKFTWMKNS